MKKYLMFLLLLHISCIGEDLIDDYVDPDLRIINPIISIQIGFSHQFKALYFDESGTKIQNPKLIWRITPDSIATIDQNGNIQAFQSGIATVHVVANGAQGKSVESKTNFEIQVGTLLGNNSTNPEGNQTGQNSETTTTISETIDLNANSEIVSGVSSATTMDGVVLAPAYYEGRIISTSNYKLEGNFRYEHNGKQLVLSLDASYAASTALPGLYVYLGNNPNTVNSNTDTYEIGAVTVFEGKHQYDLPENIEIMDYKYILYWCKPFNVKVGEAKIF